jgi:malonyl-CoA decarboxylase
VEDRNELLNCGLVTVVDPFPWEEIWSNLEQIDFEGLSMVTNDDTKSSQKEKHSVLRNVLSKLTSRYLIMEKHHGKPLNGVCKFHVGNGAIIHKINFAADLSRIGLNNSFGMMVNYMYDLDQLKENQAKFETNYTVPFSTNVSHWLQ